MNQDEQCLIYNRSKLNETLHFFNTFHVIDYFRAIFLLITFTLNSILFIILIKYSFSFSIITIQKEYSLKLLLKKSFSEDFFLK